MSVMKYGRQTRLDPNSPPLKRWWFANGISELFGTFIISFALAGLSIVTVNGTPAEHVFGHPIFVGFFEGFIIKGFLIVLLIRWSVDINPAVTLYKILVGYNTLFYGMFKIAIQMLAGFLAGVVTFAIASNVGSPEMLNEAMTAERVTSSFFKEDNTMSIQLAVAFLFVAELGLTMIYLLPIFSKGIHDEWRDLFLMLILSMNTFLGLAAGIGSGASNPARSIALQTPGLLGSPTEVFEPGHGSAQGFYMATIAMLTAGFAAPITFALTQDLLIRWVNPYLHSAIRYKNSRVARISRSVSYTSAEHAETMAKFRAHKKARLTERDPRYDEWVNE